MPRSRRYRSKVSLVSLSPCRLPLEVAVVDAQAALPALVEDRAVEAGRAGRVGVGLRRHVEPQAARAADQAEHGVDLAKRHAVDVHDVQGRPGTDRVGEDFLDRIDRHRTDVRVDGGALLAGEAEHFEDLPAGRTGVVLDGEADPQGAFLESLVQKLQHGGETFRRQFRVVRPVRGVTLGAERLVGGAGRREGRLEIGPFRPGAGSPGPSTRRD